MERKMIREQFEKKFIDLQAYCLVNNEGDNVGRVIFQKHPDKIEGSRMTCYLQIFGAEMVIGECWGGNYDMNSASFDSAAKKLAWNNYTSTDRIHLIRQMKETDFDGSHTWDRVLRDVFSIQSYYVI